MKAIAENQPTTVSESTKLVLSYSFIVSTMYVIVFALAKILNLEDHLEFRFINYLLLFFITYSALNKLYNLNGHKMEYFSGFLKTFMISLLGSLWYCILFFIYLHIDHQFTASLINQFPGNILYPYFSITAVLFIEGIAMSAIVALAIMQIFKSKRGRWASQ